MENFEETVVNPNIQLKDIGEQLRRVSKKQQETQTLIEEQTSCKKFINGYYLFALTVILILLITVVTRS